MAEFAAYLSRRPAHHCHGRDRPRDPPPASSASVGAHTAVTRCLFSLFIQKPKKDARSPRRPAGGTPPGKSVGRRGSDPRESPASPAGPASPASPGASAPRTTSCVLSVHGRGQPTVGWPLQAEKLRGLESKRGRARATGRRGWSLASPRLRAEPRRGSSPGRGARNSLSSNGLRRRRALAGHPPCL